MSRVRHSYVPLLLSLVVLFVCGKLLLTPVTRAHDSLVPDQALYVSQRLPEPYERTFLFRTEQLGLHSVRDRGWPWPFVTSLYVRNTRTEQNVWYRVEFRSWALAADVFILLLAALLIAFLAARHYRRRGRWLAFSVRELLVVTAIVAATLGWWFHAVRQHTVEKERVAQLIPKQNGIGAIVDGRYLGPAWLLRFVDEANLHIFFRAESIWCMPVPSIPNEERVKALVAALDDMPNVRYLSISGLSIQAADPTHFSRIESLHFSDYNFQDGSLDTLLHWPRLKELTFNESVAEPALSDQGLAQIGRSPNLELLRLRLATTNVTNAGLVHLGNLTKLRVLDLIGTHMRDEGIVHLIGMKQLHKLELSGTAITDAATESLLQLSALEELRLAHCEGITDEGVARLTKLPRLRLLNLAYTNVTDGVIDSLDKMPALREVDLSECENITEQGLRKLLELPQLREIYFLNHPAPSPETKRLLEQRKKEGLLFLNAKLTHL